jgi:hypothetical protein
MPTQLIAVAAVQQHALDVALTPINTSLNFIGGKGQKSYMDEFHRNVTVS